MTRAILTNWRRYTPYGEEFYEPLLDFYIKSMTKAFFQEGDSPDKPKTRPPFTKLYFLDSGWDIDPEKLKDLPTEIVKVNPSLRYYDAFKQVLSSLPEDAFLLMDNDMFLSDPTNVLYHVFWPITDGFPAEQKDVVSIFDTIGDFKTDKMNGKNKLCPYLFSARTDTIKPYLEIDWGPDMPYCETFGHLTEAMLKDGLKFEEWEEDKTDFPTKNLGYYHIRAGSTPAYLLAEKHYGNLETYWSYLKNQPKSEYLRQCEWYKRMGGNPTEIIEDSKDL